MIRRMTYKQIAEIYIDHAKKSARKYGLDTSLVLAVIAQESAGDPMAISRANAYGLMQLRQCAVTDYNQHHDSSIKMYDVLYKHSVNIEVASWYLFWLYSVVKDKRTVLRAYNAGIGNIKRGVAKAGSAYADAVLKKQEAFETLIKEV